MKLSQEQRDALTALQEAIGKATACGLHDALTGGGQNDQVANEAPIPTASEAQPPKAPFWPVLIMDGSAYSLQFGCLLAAAMMASGFTMDMQDGVPNWGEVEDFTLEPKIQTEINAAFTALINLDTEQGLIAEYAAWCAIENLPHISADEQELEVMSREQRSFLARFQVRWDRVMHGDTAHAANLNHNKWLSGDELSCEADFPAIEVGQEYEFHAEMQEAELPPQQRMRNYTGQKVLVISAVDPKDDPEVSTYFVVRAADGREFEAAEEELNGWGKALGQFFWPDGKYGHGREVEFLANESTSRQMG